MTKDSTEIKQWYSDVPSNVRRPTIAGIVVLFLAVFGFGIWASTVLIDGAVVSPGTFVATSQNKIIQHLEGGVISKILVREGDFVETGQILIKLDETAPKARLRRLFLRYSRLKAMQVRLRAESELQSDIFFPDKVTVAASDPYIKEILDGEKRSFLVRQRRLKSEIAILEQGMVVFQERVTGSKSQLKSVGEQLGFISEELQAKRILQKKGYIRKPEILALQRSQARLVGEEGRLRAEIGDVRERIARVVRQIKRTKYIHVEKAVQELQEVKSEIDDVSERIRSSRNVLNRIEINAPVKGIVVKMRYHTPGGVIEAGKDILELLPIGDELIIEAQVRPQDIDNVKIGQEAIIRLNALNQRVTPMIPGKVIYVSADTLPQDKKGVLSREDIYIARVRLDTVKAAEMNFHPTPGMPTEVYIKTSSRTFFEYIMLPVVNSMSRAFREP